MRPRGWTHAATFTFQGRVHRACLNAYRKMKPLMWDLYYLEDGTRRDHQVDEWQGFGPVLEELGVPRDGDDWDKTHPGFAAWWHGVHNLGTMFRMMEPR